MNKEIRNNNMTQYLNLTTKQLKTESEIRSANPHTSYPHPFPLPDGYAIVFDAPQPAHDAYAEYVTQLSPVLTVKGHYEQQWSVSPLTGEDLAAAQERKLLDDTTKESQRIQSLWQAAHDYEYAAINGSAIGLVTIGIMKGLPKSIAMQAWIQSIWNEYYTRKANLSTDFTFDELGVCPHTIPELMVELGL